MESVLAQCVLNAMVERAVIRQRLEMVREISSMAVGVVKILFGKNVKLAGEKGWWIQRKGRRYDNGWENKRV